MAEHELYLPKKKTTVCLGAAPELPGRKKVRFSQILATAGLPYFEKNYDVEIALSGRKFPGRMFLNNIYGDCEVASIANWTLAAEYKEQNKLIDISDENVKKFYFHLTGGADSGLDDGTVLDAWQKQGWDVDEPLPAFGSDNWSYNVQFLKQHPRLSRFLSKCPCHWDPNPPAPTSGQHLNIYASAALDSYDEMRCAIYHLYGIRVTIKVPQYAIDQFDAGEPWDYDPKGNQTLRGYHSIEGPAYFEDESFEDWTWKVRQKVTRRFFDHNMVAAFCMVDNKNIFQPNSTVDPEKLKSVMKQIQAG